MSSCCSDYDRRRSQVLWYKLNEGSWGGWTGQINRPHKGKRSPCVVWKQKSKVSYSDASNVYHVTKLLSNINLF